MGVKTKAGYWCDWCGAPVAGEKTTHRVRGAVGIIAAPMTGGLSLGLTVPDRYHCPCCGNPVRPATTDDYATLTHAEAEPRAQHSAPAPPRRASSWQDAPAEEVPPWRQRDRERLDGARTPASQAQHRDSLAVQLRQLAELHNVGALTDDEFAAAKCRLLADQDERAR
jgi:putative oligomerization/nucleic acid binding protein